MQAAAGSLTRSTLAACRHEPLSESARRSPWLPPTAPVPPPRFACFVAGSIEAIRHASISRRGSLCSPMRRLLLAWLRQRHQARRIGSLFVQAPSSGQHAPCRGWGRRASPRGTSAAMAAANSVSRTSSARFWCGAVFVGGDLSRLPPLCGPCGYCLRQTPSVPLIGYHLSRYLCSAASPELDFAVGPSIEPQCCIAANIASRGLSA